MSEEKKPIKMGKFTIHVRWSDDNYSQFDCELPFETRQEVALSIYDGLRSWDAKNNPAAILHLDTVVLKMADIRYVHVGKQST